MHLHTRHNYGKLGAGVLVCVPHTLIKRSATHFISLECGVDVIFGKNGFVWLTPTASSSASKKDEVNVSVEIRLRLAKVKNLISVLGTLYTQISADLVNRAMDLFEKREAKYILTKESITELVKLGTE